MRIIIILLFFIITHITTAQDALLWEFSARMGIYSSPVIDGDKVFFGSNDSTLYVLDKTSGDLIRKFKATGQIRSRPLILAQSIIFNCSDGSIYSLEKNTCSVNWTFKTEGEKPYDLWDYYLSSPVYSGNNIYVGSGDGNIYCIDPEKGELVWKYQTGDIVHATPVCNDSLVLTGSFDGYFYALDKKTGTLKWKFRTVGEAYFPKGEIQRGAVLYKNAVIFGSRDYNLYALNISTGRGLWNMKEKGSWIIATPLVYEDNLFVGTSDSHRFFTLNAENGNEQWSLPLNMRVYGSAVLHQSYLYFGCFNGKLYRVDPQTGTPGIVFQTPESTKYYSSIYKDDDTFRDDFQLYGDDMLKSENRILGLGSILSTPVIDNAIIYFGDANGTFYAVKLNPE